MTLVYTVGHSNRPVAELVAQLQAAGIATLADIRRQPFSRRNPQFNRNLLAAVLQDAGIRYVHFEALGGRRESRADSQNLGVTDEALRGFADYCSTAAFEAALRQLLREAEAALLAMMCAEAAPAGCHRSLLSDVLVARGHEVVHLLPGSQVAHRLHPRARIEDGQVSYPSLL